MAEMTQYAESLKSRLRTVETAPPPLPWRLVKSMAVGGLVCVGLTGAHQQQELVVVVSVSGRSVVDALARERLARDRSDIDASWFDELSLEVDGIGPLEGQSIAVAGLWGGGLRRMTPDLWTVDVLSPDWPEHMVVLQPPGRQITLEERSSGCVVIDRPVTEVRAVGFSSSGNALVEATSSDLHLYARARD